MKLTRYLKPAQVKIELTVPETDKVWDMKYSVLEQIVGLLNASGKVVSKSKLFTDLLNRERKATTAIGEGLAIPHVRTLQAKDLIIAFARSTAGIDFDSLDHAKSHIFFSVVAPPYDDALYTDVYKNIALFIKRGDRKNLLMTAKTEHDIIKVISDFEID